MLAPGERLVAVLDTCVLAPMPLCDTLPRLAEEPALYTPKWSADILRELRSTLQRMGYTLAQADRRIAAMTNHPNDRHVLAAAVRCEAQAIVTSNVKDFGPDSVKPHGLCSRLTNSLSNNFASGQTPFWRNLRRRPSREALRWTNCSSGCSGRRQ
jgi:hypothetical protein